MNDGDRPDVVAPPPLIVLGCFAIGLGLDAATDFLGLSIPWPLRWLGALVPLGFGGRLILQALGRFREAGTRPEPWKPTTAIVETGPYRWTRNPMYLGMVLACDAIFALMTVLPVIVILRLGVIAREEVYLLGKFGEPYRAYMARVGRWF